MGVAPSANVDLNDPKYKPRISIRILGVISTMLTVVGFIVFYSGAFSLPNLPPALTGLALFLPHFCMLFLSTSLVVSSLAKRNTTYAITVSAITFSVMNLLAHFLCMILLPITGLRYECNNYYYYDYYNAPQQNLCPAAVAIIVGLVFLTVGGILQLSTAIKEYQRAPPQVSGTTNTTVVYVNAPPGTQFVTVPGQAQPILVPVQNQQGYPQGQPMVYPQGQPMVYPQGQPQIIQQGQPQIIQQGQPMVYPQGQPQIIQQGQPMVYPQGQPQIIQQGQPQGQTPGQPMAYPNQGQGTEAPPPYAP